MQTLKFSQTGSNGKHNTTKNTLQMTMN